MKRLMSNGTVRPTRPGKFDRVIAALSFAAGVVQLNNLMRKPVERKQYPIAGRIVVGEGEPGLKMNNAIFITQGWINEPAGIIEGIAFKDV